MASSKTPPFLGVFCATVRLILSQLDGNAIDFFFAFFVTATFDRYILGMNKVWDEVAFFNLHW